MVLHQQASSRRSSLDSGCHQLTDEIGSLHIVQTGLRHPPQTRHLIDQGRPDDFEREISRSQIKILMVPCAHRATSGT
ncbi:hypothetical protein XH98_06350 [Bradyrhizobium sp. CCBAU 51745]|nr:hypothetical protein [Bradyrhizobium sp. CCBAU 51745]